MKTLPTLALATVTVAGGWIGAAALYSGSAYAASFPIQPAYHAPYNAAVIDEAIKFHQTRVERDPQGAIGWAMLSDAWLARSRESDSDNAAWEAEAAAGKSWSIRQRGNSHALVGMVNSMLEQHRFQDALHTLEENKVRNRLTADVLIEMGRYDEAKKVLDSLKREEDPTIDSTYAHMASVQGDHAKAKHLLETTRGVLQSNPAVSQATLAWFDVKLGDEYRALGDDTRAESLYRGALQAHPRNYKATLAMARLMAARKDWKESIHYGQATLEIADSLDAKSMIGDAYQAMGDTENAHRWYEICHRTFLNEVALFDKLGKGGPFHVRPIDRQFAQFSLEHKRFVQDGLVAAKRDLANRPDPHAKQTLAGLEKLNAMEVTR